MSSPTAPRESHVDLATFARAAGAFALAGGSVALALEQSRGKWVTAFTSANVSSRPQRDLLLIGLAIGVAVGVAVALVLWAFGGPRVRASLPAAPEAAPSAARARRSGFALPGLSRASCLAAPLLLAGFVPGLLRVDAWTDTLTLAIVLCGFLLLAERLFRIHFQAYADAGGAPPDWAWPAWTARLGAVVRARVARMPRALRRNAAVVVVGGAAAAYVAYMSFYTLRNHARFNTFTWDLGQLDNQFYNFLHGHPFRCTALIREGNWSELRNHAEAAMFFLLPFYAIHPSASTLLVMQAVLMAGGGVFLYRFAARRLSRPVALALLGAYYFYPPLHGAQFFDFHFQPVAAAFLLAAIDFFDARRMKLFAVFFVLAILCREDISVGTAVLGLFLIVTGHRPRAGAVIVAVSLTYFVLLRFVIMPAVGQWGFAEHYHNLFPEGEHSFSGIVKTIVTNPTFTFTTLLTHDKLRYLLQILLPLAFLPLRRIHLALSVLPGAYFTLLTDYGPTLDIGYQYSGYFIPYIFPAAALALEAMGRLPDGVVRRRAAVATLIAATVLSTAHWGAIPPRKSFHSSYGAITFDPPTREQRQEGRDLDDLVRLVPRDAVLAVTDREMPHVSNRVECWNFSVGYQGSDYVIYTTDHPIQPEREMYDAMIRGGYVKVAERPGLVLYKRPDLR